MSTNANNSRSFRMQTVIEVAGNLIGYDEITDENIAKVEKICSLEAKQQKFNIKCLIMDYPNLVQYAAKLRALPRQKSRYGTED